MKVAVIGTVGLPANYGGFETLVEQLVRHNRNENLQYVVYCSNKSYTNKQRDYQGAKLEYIGLEANGIQSIPYDIISLIRASRKNDIILILGVSGCAFLPVFRLFSKKKLIINIDGLEHRRDKWNKWVRKFLKFSEKQAVKYGDIIVTDNKGITDYVYEEYGKSSELIAYGGDHVLTEINEDLTDKVLTKYELRKEEYALGICRIEPENNVHLILEAFEKANKKIVFIGNWTKNEFGRQLAGKYKNSEYVRITSAVYDLDILNVLRSNCNLYLHGHSAGGTNPSLVEAMFFSKPIIAYDCIYNRESTESKAHYFKSVEDLQYIIGLPSSEFTENAKNMAAIANRRYKWTTIAKQYEQQYSS